MYVFSKDAILGSVPSISSEVLDVINYRAREGQAVEKLVKIQNPVPDLYYRELLT